MRSVSAGNVNLSSLNPHSTDEVEIPAQLTDIWEDIEINGEEEERNRCSGAHFNVMVKEISNS